jgi:hypothetical protein
MFLVKKVIRRTEGMGMRFSKFHSISHITNDIRNMGVCSGLDTGSNESGHKPKTAAMLTQKNAATFDQQTQTRLMETHLLSLATAEIEGRLWHYLQGYDNKTETPQNVYLDRWGQIRVPVS